MLPDKAVDAVSSWYGVIDEKVARAVKLSIQSEKTEENEPLHFEDLFTTES